MRVALRHAFSLIELLVVIGITAILIGLLAPALSAIHRTAKRIQCQAQLRELGHALQMYQNENGGWLYPCDRNPDTGKMFAHWGTAVPPHERWPMKVFKIPTAPLPPKYDISAYDPATYQPDLYPAGPYTPPILTCPTDVDPVEGHTYMLNFHLADHGIKAGGHDFAGLTSSDIIVAGEKLNYKVDYYLQTYEFDNVVDKYRHGVEGSNYLYMDGHVATVQPENVMRGLDPWDDNKLQAPADQ